MPLTDFLNATGNGVYSGYTVSTQRYIVGGVAELRLPLGFGVEFDALYRHLHYDGSIAYTVPFTGLVYALPTRTTGNNWEFPLLLKYRFHVPVVRPYLDAGAAWDTLAGLKQTIMGGPINPGGPVVPAGTTTTSSPSELKENTTMGFVLGGGVDIHAAFLHISPEIRFTRWNSAQIGDTFGLLRSNRNQAEFIVGFTF